MVWSGDGARGRCRWGNFHWLEVNRQPCVTLGGVVCIVYLSIWIEHKRNGNDSRIRRRYALNELEILLFNKWPQRFLFSDCLNDNLNYGNSVYPRVIPDLRRDRLGRCEKSVWQRRWRQPTHITRRQAKVLHIRHIRNRLANAPKSDSDSFNGKRC